MTKNVKEEDIYNFEQKFKKYETIINAMSAEERTDPDIVAAQGEPMYMSGYI